jgi:hypothetical protein
MKKNNLVHQWRHRPIPERVAQCVLCDAFFGKKAMMACIAVDHDLRGDICPACVEPVRNAESALVETVGICAPGEEAS